jgi:hypothetical protein
MVAKGNRGSAFYRNEEFLKYIYSELDEEHANEKQKA